jgi:Cft2 family RNA processing exonuclease
VLFVGYQAEGTPGRQLLEEPSEAAEVTISALMYPEQADEPRADIITERQPEADPAEVETEANDHFDFHEKTIEVPTAWTRRVSGLSGHADANTLLQFARSADPEQIHLVHGPRAASEHLREHIANNADAGTVRVADHQETIDVTATGAVVDARDELESLKSDRDVLKQNLADLTDRIESLERRLNELEE